jgi:hypothetical protein
MNTPKYWKTLAGDWKEITPYRQILPGGTIPY